MNILKTYNDVIKKRKESGEKILLITMLLNFILLILYMLVAQYANILNVFNKNSGFFNLKTFIAILANGSLLYFALSINRMLLYFPIDKTREKLSKVFSSNPVELLVIKIFTIVLRFIFIFIGLYIIVGSVLQIGIDTGVATPYSIFNPELLESGLLEVNTDFFLKLFTWKDIILSLGLIVGIEVIMVKFIGAKYIIMMSDAAVGVIQPLIDSFKGIKGDDYKLLLKIRFKYLLLAILPIPFLIIPLIFSSKFLLIIYLLFVLFFELYIRSIYLIEEAFFIGHGPLIIRLYDYVLYRTNIQLKSIELSNNAKTCGIK